MPAATPRRPTSGGALLATLATALLAGPAAAQAHDPFQDLIAEAWRHNSSLRAARAEERAADAAARQAMAALRPSAELSSRYSEQTGILNFGDLLNSAYAELNRLSGTERFPTNLDLTLPLRHESRIRLSQSVFAPGLRSLRDAALHESDAQRARRLGHARRLAADVQTAFLRAAAAADAVSIGEAARELAVSAERMSQRAVDAGIATPDAVLRARADRRDADQQLLDARNDAAAAVRSLNQLLGRELDIPLDSIDTSALFSSELPVTLDEAVRSAVSRREELQAIASARDAADARRAASASRHLPNVAVALDYGVQGRDLTFSAEEDFLVGSVVVTWNVFDGGAASAASAAAAASAERLDLVRAESADRIQLEVTQAYDAAAAARAAIAAATDRASFARRAHELVSRRYAEGAATYLELTDARTARVAAELNLSVTRYRYAARLVALEHAAALRHVE